MTATFVNFNPALVIGCSNILFGRTRVVDGKATIIQGMEQLTTAASMCYLQTLSHLMVIDPTSEVIEDTRGRYAEVFPRSTNPNEFQFSHILRIINWALRGHHPWEDQWEIEWESYKPPSNELITVAHALTNVTWIIKRTGGELVPDWILHFVLHSLSRSPLPPASVVTDCLSIIALNLDCDPLLPVTLGQRCVCI